eukprot:7696826-Karenia_brevis.AAC.1
MATLRAEARALGDILGIATGVPADGILAKWIFADTAYGEFGNEVPSQVLGDNQRVVLRDATAL